MNASAFRFRFLILAGLLPVFDGASAQTVEWWDPAALAESGFPALEVSGDRRCGCDVLGHLRRWMTQCVEDPRFRQTHLQGPARQVRCAGRSALAEAAARIVTIPGSRRSWPTSPVSTYMARPGGFLTSSPMTNPSFGSTRTTARSCGNSAIPKATRKATGSAGSARRTCCCSTGSCTCRRGGVKGTS